MIVRTCYIPPFYPSPLIISSTKTGKRGRERWGKEGRGREGEEGEEKGEKGGKRELEKNAH